MAPMSPKPSYNLVPQSPTTSSDTCNCNRYRNSGILTFYLTPLLRLLLTTFALVSIICIIIGDQRRYIHYFGGVSHGIVSIVLVSLFSSFLGHIVCGTYHFFTSMIRIEWRTADQAFLRLPEHWKTNPFANSPPPLVCGLDIFAAVGIFTGTLIMLLTSAVQSPESVAGVVFAFLTLTLHAVLAILYGAGSRWTVTLQLIKDDAKVSDLESEDATLPLYEAQERLSIVDKSVT
ncbi:hypothetical protein MMC13_001623 [Lambiella insularis]|nr:hypothetical protein [Lambiella insularis]